MRKKSYLYNKIINKLFKNSKEKVVII